MKQFRSAAALAVIAIATVVATGRHAASKDPVDARTIAADKRIAEKLAALGAEVTFCENHLVDEVRLTSEDSDTLEPRVSTAQLPAVRLLLDKLSYHGNVSFLIKVDAPEELRQLYGIEKLSSLCLQGRTELKIEAKHLAGLGDSGSLRSLIVIGLNIEGAIPAIVEFESLEQLVLHTKVSEQSLTAFAALPNLQTLWIPHHKATDETAKTLSEFRSLEVLQIGACEITDAGMKHIAKLKRLKQVNFTNAAFSDAGLAELVACQRLKHLAIQGDRLTERGLAVVGRLTSLEHLDVSGCAVTDDFAPTIAGLANLKSLSARNTQITERGMATIRAKLPKLHAAGALPNHIDPPTAWRLWQKNAIVEWNDQGITLIVWMHGVGRANQDKLTAEDLAAVRGADHLRSLGLIDCPIRDQDLDAVLRFGELEWLCLAGTKITDVGVKRLSALTKLEHLDLAGTQVGDAAIEHLTALRRLKTIDVCRTKVWKSCAKRCRACVLHRRPANHEHRGRTGRSPLPCPAPRSGQGGNQSLLCRCGSVRIVAARGFNGIPL
jgi:Leucine-rich repeat (LRR) protein